LGYLAVTIRGFWSPAKGIATAKCPALGLFPENNLNFYEVKYLLATYMQGYTCFSSFEY
jgi:hypothetical protein